MIAVFNKYATNPVQRMWAGLVPPWALVHHTGRVSSRGFTTPVLGFRTLEGFVIPAYYGVCTHWVQNILAAGGGEVERGGVRYTLLEPRIVASADVTATGLAGRYIRGLSHRWSPCSESVSEQVRSGSPPLRRVTSVRTGKSPVQLPRRQGTLTIFGVS